MASPFYSWFNDVTTPSVGLFEFQRKKVSATGVVKAYNTCVARHTAAAVALFMSQSWRTAKPAPTDYRQPTIRTHPWSAV